MPNIGPLEIAIVLIIALLVFGPKKLPDLGRSLGRGITEFRDGLQNAGAGLDEDEEEEDRSDEQAVEEEDVDDTQPALGPGETVASAPADAEPEVVEVTPASGSDGGSGDDQPAAGAPGEAAPRSDS